MKYIVKFELEQNWIRTDYRQTFISFFKKCISNYMDGHFFSALYDTGAKRKSLVWSIKLDSPVFKGDVIKLGSNKLEMTLKCGEVETALIYYSSLLNSKNEGFPIGNGNSMSLKNIKMVNENKVSGGLAVFKVFSPICLKIHDHDNKRDSYLTVEDREFALELNKKLKEELPYMEDEIDLLKYDFEGLKKVIVPAYKIKIPASIGCFRMSGNEKILNHILNNGIGSKRNSGFGLVERML